jgi:hypothetical protein
VESPNSSGTYLQTKDLLKEADAASGPEASEAAAIAGTSGQAVGESEFPGAGIDAPRVQRDANRGDTMVLNSLRDTGLVEVTEGSDSREVVDLTEQGRQIVS